MIETPLAYLRTLCAIGCDMRKILTTQVLQFPDVKRSSATRRIPIPWPTGCALPGQSPMSRRGNDEPRMVARQGRDRRLVP
jgi:hypothetical protein